MTIGDGVGVLFCRIASRKDIVVHGVVVDCGIIIVVVNE